MTLQRVWLGFGLVLGATYHAPLDAAATKEGLIVVIDQVRFTVR